MIRVSGKRARTIFLAICLGCIATYPAVAYQTATFHFAPLGSSFLAFLPPDSPLVGHQIISARIFLDVQSDPGSDAANFFTDISFPIAPFPGNENALALSGSDLGWSGAGAFHFLKRRRGSMAFLWWRDMAGRHPAKILKGRCWRLHALNSIMSPNWVERFSFLASAQCR
jgi:hypothetical protein